MLETPDDLARLQGLLDASHGRATEHLRSIIREERVLTAAHVAGLLTGMKVVWVATVTAQGAPRISAMDGHYAMSPIPGFVTSAAITLSNPVSALTWSTADLSISMPRHLSAACVSLA